MKKAVIILRDLQASEFDRLLPVLKSENTQVYLHADLQHLAGQISNPKISIIDLKPEEKKRLNYELLDRMLAFGDKKIDGLSIADHFSFSDTASIWYYHKFRVYFLIRNKQYDKELIRKLINHDQVTEVYTDYNLTNYFDSNVSFITPVTKNKKNIVSAFKYAVFFGGRTMAGLLRNANSPKYLVLDKGNLQPVLMPDMTTRPGNYNLEYFLKGLDKKYAVLHEVEIPKLTGSTIFGFPRFWLKDRNNNAVRIFGEPQLFLALLSRKLRSAHKQIIKNVSGKYQFLMDNLQDPVEKDIISTYNSLHQTTKLFVFKYLSYVKFFRRSKFDAIISTDENSPAVKTIFDAARVNGIKTIGIQHGNIHDLHPAYRYTNDDVGRKVVPDQTLIWGTYWKNLLIEKGNYSADQLSITGQFRTDIIPVIREKARHLFDESKINIVFASQPQRDPKIRRQAALDVFRSVKTLGNDYFLHLKLHPRENADRSYYRAIAKEVGCVNYEFTGESDLYRIIDSCQVLITCFSTVGTETVYFYKPLIILDHLKQDIQNYHKEGVAFQVTNATELTACIQNLTERNFKVNREAYARFIEKYAYKIDGQACKRAMQFIEAKKD